MRLFLDGPRKTSSSLISVSGGSEDVEHRLRVLRVVFSSNSGFRQQFTHALGRPCGSRSLDIYARSGELTVSALDTGSKPT